MCFWRDHAYVVDWTRLPDDARPVRFRHGFSTIGMGGVEVESGWSGVDFGYEATIDGRSVQKVDELR